MADPATHASTIAWLVGLKEQVFKSEADWMQFLKGLAANRPMFVASFGPTPAPVESGEKPIGISIPKYILTKPPPPLAWGPQSGQPLLGNKLGRAPGREKVLQDLGDSGVRASLKNKYKSR